jgi:hypothetical protein
MTATQIHRSTVRTTHNARASIGRVLGGCVVGAVAGSAALLAYGAAAVAIHGPMHAANHGANHAVPIVASSFPIGVLFSAFFGTVLAVALARWAAPPVPHVLPRRDRSDSGLVGGAARGLPHHRGHAADLAGGHIVAAAIIIPIIVRSLRSQRA